MDERPTPVAGMPATYCIGADCYPVTITRVSPSGSIVWYRDDGEHHGLFLPGMGGERRANRCADGRYRCGRSGYLFLGSRKSYRDPSF